jgi:hypothetical protein
VFPTGGLSWVKNSPKEAVFDLETLRGINCRFSAMVCALKGSHAWDITLLVSPNVEPVSTSLWYWNDLSKFSIEHSWEHFEAKTTCFSAPF